MAFFERYYGKVFKSLLWAINPLKKQVIETECQVHRFINYKSIKLLKKFDFDKEFELFNYYLEELNKGVVWADQDFKSINHFYSPSKKRGLYGHSNALTLTMKYYNNALEFWKNEDIENAMFYLGACVHIIQDITVPQHVNIRLLDSHRKYENFVKVTYDIVAEYVSYEKPIKFSSLEHFIRFNSKQAMEIYNESKEIEDEKERFHHITKCILPLSQRTTAGCLLLFLEEVGYKQLR
ncbi:zinc dependent phospholipase C family protein [Sporosalibacterium faouarense]|uniref:zinc dependent phospholipase C family protein n=1 Tax=Sporosalibacterium faouarense TaxID=516123 RepID=UPI00141CA967|nr:zinc dependent phospholipase C family protein [Sporosalibacterium faouarense]MTI46892.1 phospholipase [Bacillota bacterium]